MNLRLPKFLTDERGVTSIEYGILAAGLAIAIGAVVAPDGTFSHAINTIFENIVSNMPKATSGSGS